MKPLEVRFVLYDAATGDAVSKTSLLLDVSTTYEEIIRLLVQKQFLKPLDNPRLRYKFVKQS